MELEFLNFYSSLGSQENVSLDINVQSPTIVDAFDEFVNSESFEVHFILSKSGEKKQIGQDKMENSIG